MAKKYALDGDRYMVECNILQIKNIQKKVHVEINWEELSIDPLQERNYLLKSINDYLIDLEYAVRNNNIKDITWYKNLIKTFKKKLNDNINNQLNHVIKLPSFQDSIFSPLENYLKKAKKYADIGDELMMNYYIEMAKEESLLKSSPEFIPSMNIDPMVKKTFIQNEIVQLYQESLHAASLGDWNKTHHNIKCLHLFGKKIGQDVQDKIQDIEDAYDKFKYSKSI
jgi:hypothetical protein